MFALIMSFIQGIVSGVVTPMFGWLNKKQDTELAGFQAGTAEDQAKYLAYIDYQPKIAALSAQQAQTLGVWFKILYFIAGFFTVMHYSMVMIDSSFPLHLNIAKLPGLYGEYEGWVIGSLFVHAAIAAPISAAASWLHRQ